MAFREIPIAETISSDLSDFPIYVKPSAMDGWSSLTQAEADSIRFYADSNKNTELPREVVSSDEIHVKKGTLSDGDSIYADYDGVRSDYADSDTYGAENVWSSQYALVSHDGGGTDSTSNGNDGTANGGVTAGGVTGKVGGATDFDGNDDLFDIDGIETDINKSNDYSVSFWFKADDTADSGGVMFDSTTGGHDRNVARLDSGTIRFNIYNGSWENKNIASGSFSDETSFHYFFATHDLSASSDAVRAWVDNSELTGTNYNGSSKNIGASIGGSTNGSSQFDGKLDEIRVVTTKLSTGWKSTEYNNQNDPATFFGTVADVNKPPTAKNDSATTDQGSSANIDVLANDSDPDGDPITLDSTTSPSNGTITVENDDTITYSPNTGYYGSDSFTYTISDDQGETSTATVDVTVNQLSPTVNDDSATTDEDVPANIDVLANDSDPNGEELSVASVTQPSKGSVTIESDETVTYDPPTNENEFVATFDYTAENTSGYTATGSVEVVVGSVPDKVEVSSVGLEDFAKTYAEFKGSIDNIIDTKAKEYGFEYGKTSGSLNNSVSKSDQYSEQKKKEFSDYHDIGSGDRTITKTINIKDSVLDKPRRTNIFLDMSASGDVDTNDEDFYNIKIDGTQVESEVWEGNPSNDNDVENLLTDSNGFLKDTIEFEYTVDDFVDGGTFYYTFRTTYTVYPFGVGDYQLLADDLDENSTYYFRFFAVNDGGTAYGNEIQFVTEDDPPVIDNIDPSSTYLNQTQKLTITGKRFKQNTQVKINGNVLSGFTFVSPNEIEATAPAKSDAGDVDVVVENPDGNTDSAEFYYVEKSPEPQQPIEVNADCVIQPIKFDS